MLPEWDFVGSLLLELELQEGHQCSPVIGVLGVLAGGFFEARDVVHDGPVLLALFVVQFFVRLLVRAAISLRELAFESDAEPYGSGSVPSGSDVAVALQLL